MKTRWMILAAMVLAPTAVAVGQMEMPPVVVASPAPAVPPAPTLAPVVLPAGTVLVLRLETSLNSKTATTGQSIAFTVARTHTQDGRELIPAGSPVEGEVTHAAKASWGGKPGELMLAARRLKLSAGVLRLRSSLGMVGADTTSEAMALSFFTPLALGAFLSGREIDLPAGAFFAARTAEAFAFPLPADSLPATSPADASNP